MNTLKHWMSDIGTTNDIIWTSSFFSDDYILICVQVSPNNDSCSSDSNFFPSFLPSHPGAPVSILLCCFKICMSLRNASHGSKLCVSQPPTWWNDPFKAGSICLNLHSSSLSKASGFGTLPRNILIKAHRLFSTGEEVAGSSQALSTMDGWRFTAGKRGKSKAFWRSLFLSLSASPPLLSPFPLCVCARLFCTVFLCVPRTETDKARGSEWEREGDVWAKGEEGYIRKKWKRMDVCLCLCVCCIHIYVGYVCALVITKKLIST